MLLKDAPLVWNQLRGIICVYKPADVHLHRIRKSIIHNICTELNEMKCRPPMDFVTIQGDDVRKKLEVVVQPSLADDPMVVGPRYQHQDLLCSWSNYLGRRTSGVLLLGIKRGTSMAKYIRENHPTRAYHIKGTFGSATEDYWKTGKVVEKSTFNHVKLYYLEKLLTSMQAAHQRKMFELCGVDMQSQTGYELALQGIIRPSHSKLPVIYGIKCTKFDLPDFEIEIQCVNEYETYLMALIHEIGIKLKSTAHCTGIKCIRHSYFTVENALLPKHFKLQNIVSNMESCEKIINAHDNILRNQTIALRE